MFIKKGNPFLNRFCALLPLLTATPALAQTVVGAKPAMPAVDASAAPANDTAALAPKLSNPVAAAQTVNADPAKTVVDAPAAPADDTAALAPKLSNPVAAAQTVGANPAITVVDAPAAPADDTAALALKLSNPVAALISVPFQFNFDGDIGPKVAGERKGERITLNIQPVVPISLNSDWNMISRTIVPVVWQNDIIPGSGSQFGLGDTVQSLFFSPAVPKGAIWGVGPVLLVPTGSDDLLSGRKWGGGPTGVVLKQMGTITVGALANHIWSFAGNSARNDISTTYANPFISNALKSGFTYGLAADITYDWKGDRWTMPVSISASQVRKIGGQLVSIGGGLRYYAVANETSPHGFAGRFVVALLFPN
jgi:hypothetical protein